jgi:hypothetical protein
MLYMVDKDPVLNIHIRTSAATGPSYNCMLQGMVKELNVLIYSSSSLATGEEAHRDQDRGSLDEEGGLDGL